MRLLRGFGQKARNLREDPDEFRATLVEHLEELRNRIFRSLFFIAAGWAIGWFVEPSLYAILDRVVRNGIQGALPNGSSFIIAFSTVTEPFMLQIRLSFIIGLLIAAPFVILQLWGFIAPGLKPSERKPFARLAPFSLLLFLIGASFCWMILPTAIHWFAEFLRNYANASLIQDPNTIIMFSMKLVLAFGLGFQLPLVIWVLGALNLLSAETLMKYWRQGALGVFVFSGAVTPSNDAFTMLMMAVPLTILFIASVYAVKITQRRQKIKPWSERDDA